MAENSGKLRQGTSLSIEGEPKTAQLLAEWRGGAVDARNALIARLHPELSTIAAARLRAERGTSLSTGDLINESVMRIATSDGREYRASACGSSGSAGLYTWRCQRA